MKRSDALVIVPAYNESESIESVVGTLEALPYDYIVINDGSTDSTAQKLDAMGAAHIGLCRNLGIGGAVQTGYKYALAGGWSVAVQFDGDGQHDAECIGRLIEPVLAGEADLTVGSRFVESENEFLSSRSRRAGIRYSQA